MKEMLSVLLKVLSIGLAGYAVFGILFIPFGIVDVAFYSDLYRPFVNMDVIGRVITVFVMFALAMTLLPKMYGLADKMEKSILS